MSWQIRRQPVDTVIGLQAILPSAGILKYVDQALETDPYAPDLLRDRALLIERLK